MEKGLQITITGASCNYVVGYDGSIGLCVDENNRSWCSSNKANDHRAITIEVASETVPPYRVTNEAMKSLIDLVADICKRNNIKKLLWHGDKSLVGQVDKQNMTVHRWFAKKSCPGDYLYGKHSYIASEVNKILDGDLCLNGSESALEKPTNDCMEYYERYTGAKTTLYYAMYSLGIDASYSNRKKIAVANGIANYKGTAQQNTEMYNLLVAGKLKKEG